MQVKVIYKSGKRTVWDTTYLSFEGDLNAVVMVDEFDPEDLDSGVFLTRRFFNNRGERYVIDSTPEPSIAVLTPADYVSVKYVMVDGDIVLESDGEGWLIKPEDSDIEDHEDTENLEDLVDEAFDY